MWAMEDNFWFNFPRLIPNSRREGALDPDNDMEMAQPEVRISARLYDLCFSIRSMNNTNGETSMLGR